MTSYKAYSVPRIHLTGSSYEVSGSSNASISYLTDSFPASAKSTQIGLQHGKLLAPQILDQLAIYRDLFEEACKFDWPHVRKEAGEFRVGIGRLAPDLLEEMKGIADGVSTWQDTASITTHSPKQLKGWARVDILDIVALNARSEIALGLWDDGCTALGWKIRAPGCEKQILAQNWDWREGVAKNLALVSIAKDGKPKIWMVIEVCIGPRPVPCLLDSIDGPTC